MDGKLLGGILAGAALATAGMVLAGRTLTRPEYGEVVRVHPRVVCVDRAIRTVRMTDFERVF